MTRKIPGLTAALAVMFALTACGQNTASTPDSNASAPAETAAPAPAAAETSHSDAPHWSYEGEAGPEHWGELESEFATCETGKSQSPINIDHTKIVRSGEIKPIEPHYGKLTDATVINNGHTIQVNVTGEDNYVMLDGQKYTLLQFHFHHPSEHQIDGKNAEMELHFVHQNDKGEKAVVGVLINPGKANAVFADLWKHLPEKASEEAVPLASPIDLSVLLPQDLHSVHYDGSLTTPPCTEHVNWNVLEQPIELSQEQIDLFAKLFPDNHRPVQELGDRTLSEGE
ncbi:carbonic anhydrase [Saccharibacillus alkalitolerans]|uniref:carbonic anhydrase n=1 Tax=Saccharibacillus alkalitolerans TaxID=2705290 RepID=A0ABX0F9F1_9BACL|nr:carbonic anhydrase family protein [Saccharibacillus alkalitolerans]NGZ77060.1 carbonic anhydrase family protein [Saccharibacillus alkalitolerans]